MSRFTWMLLAAFVALMTIDQALAATGEATTSPAQMSNYALYGILLGFIGTYVTAFINRCHWPNYLRFGTYFVWSVIASAGDASVTRDLDWHNWSRAFLVVLVAGIAFYNLNKGAIKDFEAATS